jgi:hypothetical protein
VRLGIITVHRCQVVALDGFNPSIRALTAVMLMAVMIMAFLDSIDRRHRDSLKGMLGHSGQQSAGFQPDLRSLRYFCRLLVRPRMTQRSQLVRVCRFG